MVHNLVHLPNPPPLLYTPRLLKIGTFFTQPLLYDPPSSLCIPSLKNYFPLFYLLCCTRLNLPPLPLPQPLLFIEPKF